MPVPFRPASRSCHEGSVVPLSSGGPMRPARHGGVRLVRVVRLWHPLVVADGSRVQGGDSRDGIVGVSGIVKRSSWFTLCGGAPVLVALVGLEYAVMPRGYAEDLLVGLIALALAFLLVTWAGRFLFPFPAALACWMCSMSLPRPARPRLWPLRVFTLTVGCSSARCCRQLLGVLVRWPLGCECRVVYRFL